MPTPPLGQLTPIPAPPARHSSRAYTTISWFIVLGLGIASFSALIAVATLLATARPVRQWTVPVARPAATMQPTTAEQACATDDDCVVVGNSCDGCGCGTVVNRGSQAAYEQRLRTQCRNYRGAVCETSCPIIIPRCYAGRCDVSVAERTDLLPMAGDPAGLSSGASAQEDW